MIMIVAIVTVDSLFPYAKQVLGKLGFQASDQGQGMLNVRATRSVLSRFRVQGLRHLPAKVWTEAILPNLC